MLSEVARALEAAAFEEGRILVAVSGGVDSTVLAHALNALAAGRGFDVAIGHVNHGLRGEASEADAALVESLAASLSLPFYAKTVAPADLRTDVSSRERPSLQEAARTLRRDACLAMALAAGAHRIATAHNADDQAETVLLRLLRGCGPDSLGGIGEVSPDGVFLRPLLGVSRSEILAYAEAEGLAWREDASNQDTRYARNRLRHDLLPRLAADFNPKLLRAIGDLAEAHRRDAEWVETLVRAEAERRFVRVGCATEIAAEGWRELPEGLARRLVRHLLIEHGAGRELSRTHLKRTLLFLREGPMVDSARKESTLELPGGLRLARTRTEFRLARVKGLKGPKGRERPEGAAGRSAGDPPVDATKDSSGRTGGAVLRSGAGKRSGC